MENSLLELKPRRYLCPLCGRWHEWNNRVNLRGGSWYSPIVFNAGSFYPTECAFGKYSILITYKRSEYTDRTYMHYACQSDWCNYFVLKGEVWVATFKEHSDKPIVTVDVPLVPKSEWWNTKMTCKQCSRFKNCNFYKQYIAGCIDGDFNHPKVQLGFEFEPSEYEKFSEVGQKRRAEALKKREYALKHLEEFERTLNGKEQALEERERTLKKREQALEEREQALQKQKDEFKDHEQSG